MKIHEMEINVTRAEFEALKAEIQVFEVETCPLDIFTKFRDNVQKDHAIFTVHNNEKLEAVHATINTDMKTVIQETKVDLDRAHRDMEQQLTNNTPQITTTQLTDVTVSRAITRVAGQDLQEAR